MKTGNSVSDVACGNKVITTQGKGQRNGNGSTLWCLKSTKMMAMMKKKDTVLNSNHFFHLL